MQEKRLQNKQKANKLYPSTRYKPPTPLLSLQSMDPPSKLHVQKLNRSSESIRIHSISKSPILKTVEKRFHTIQRKDQESQKAHHRQKSERRLYVSQNRKKEQTLGDKQIEDQNALREKLVRMKIEIQKIHGEHIDLEDIQFNGRSQKQLYYRERMKKSGSRIIAKVLKSKIRMYLALLIARPRSQLKIQKL